MLCDSRRTNLSPLALYKTWHGSKRGIKKGYLRAGFAALAELKLLDSLLPLLAKPTSIPKQGKARSPDYCRCLCSILGVLLPPPTRMLLGFNLDFPGRKSYSFQTRFAGSLKIWYHGDSALPND